MICWPEKQARSEALVSNNALWIKHPLSTYSDTARSVFVPYSFLLHLLAKPKQREVAEETRTLSVAPPSITEQEEEW